MVSQGAKGENPTSIYLIFCPRDIRSAMHGPYRLGCQQHQHASAPGSSF